MSATRGLRTVRSLWRPHSWICLIAGEAVTILPDCLGLRGLPQGFAGREVSQPQPQSFWKQLPFEDWGTRCPQGQGECWAQWIRNAHGSYAVSEVLAPQGWLDTHFPQGPPRERRIASFPQKQIALGFCPSQTATFPQESNGYLRVPDFMWSSDNKRVSFKRDACSVLFCRYWDGKNFVATWLCSKVFRVHKLLLWT